MKPSQKYLIRELQSLGRVRVLDFACSKGKLWDRSPANAEMFGCDIRLTPEMAERIKGREDRFRLSVDPARIPFEDSTFDIVFANSAFEHVRPIAEIVAECARVLKPGGRLIAVFPCKTVIYEPHIGVPLAQLSPAGRFRRFWCKIWYLIANREKFRTGEHVRADEYLTRCTNYLFAGQYQKMFRAHFDSTKIITRDLVRLSGRHSFLPTWLVSRLYALGIDAKVSSSRDQAAKQ